MSIARATITAPRIMADITAGPGATSILELSVIVPCPAGAFETPPLRTAGVTVIEPGLAARQLIRDCRSVHLCQLDPIDHPQGRAHGFIDPDTGEKPLHFARSNLALAAILASSDPPCSALPLAEPQQRRAGVVLRRRPATGTRAKWISTTYLSHSRLPNLYGRGRLQGHAQPLGADPAIRWKPSG